MENLKKRIYEALCILNKKFPNYDICIVGSSSLYIRNIDYKVPEDLDIVILNENLQQKSHYDYKRIVAYAAYKETGLYIDALGNKHGKFDYDIIDLYDKKVKVIKPELYLEMKKKFSENKNMIKSKRDKHKKTIPLLEEVINKIKSKNDEKTEK
jgi:hypothetical protein